MEKINRKKKKVYEKWLQNEKNENKQLEGLYRKREKVYFKSDFKKKE